MYFSQELKHLDLGYRENDNGELDKAQHRREFKYGRAAQEIHCGAAFGEVALMMKGSLRLVSLQILVLVVEESAQWPRSICLHLWS